MNLQWTPALKMANAWENIAQAEYEILSNKIDLNEFYSQELIFL